MTTYKIVRMYFSDARKTRTIKTGLTLEEAREHCTNPETSSRTATSRAAINRTNSNGPWFDGYEEEK